MIFSVEPETQHFVVRVPAKGGQEVYDCTAHVCSSPVCCCRTTTVTMRPRFNAGIRRTISVDLDTMAIDEHFRKRTQDLAFAEELFAVMDVADFELLGRLHSFLKNCNRMVFSDPVCEHVGIATPPPVPVDPRRSIP